MQLKDLVKEYRAAHGVSQRQFATMCGLSNGYISMLENDVNPKTGLPLSPSVVALKKIAAGMGITLNELLSRVDDMPVDLSLPSNFTAPDAANAPSELTEFLTLFRNLAPEEKKMLIAQMRGLTAGR